jgi:hypothetical protein
VSQPGHDGAARSVIAKAVSGEKQPAESFYDIADTVLAHLTAARLVVQPLEVTP